MKRDTGSTIGRRYRSWSIIVLPRLDAALQMRICDDIELTLVPEW